MPSYKVSFNLQTQLSINEVRAVLGRDVEQLTDKMDGQFLIKNLSVIKGTDSRAEQKQRLIAEQKQWIEQCGGTLEGYIQRYGSKNDDEFFGAGGEEIYAADIAQLARLQEM